MSTSGHLSHIVFGTALTAGLCLAAWQIVKSAGVEEEYRRHNSRRPRLSKEELLALLRELESRASAAVQTIEDAIAGAADDDERDVLRLGARAAVQRDLEAAQDAVLVKFGGGGGSGGGGGGGDGGAGAGPGKKGGAPGGVGGQPLAHDDLTTALAYYTSGAGGGDPAVDAASLSLRRVGARYLLTKASVLEAMGKTYEVQAEMLVATVQQAIESGAVRTPAQAQRLLAGPEYRRAAAAALAQVAVRITGLDADEIDEITRRPEWMGDAAFQAGISALAEKAQRLNEAADRQLQQMLMEAAQQGGGGGMGMGMGMGGMMGF